MRRIVEKSILTGILSVLASLAISFSIVPLLGGQVAGAGLLMTIFCPLAISIPASALHFTQSDKVRRAEAATKEALNKLADAYEALRIQSRSDGLTVNGGAKSGQCGGVKPGQRQVCGADMEMAPIGAISMSAAAFSIRA